MSDPIMIIDVYIYYLLYTPRTLNLSLGAGVEHNPIYINTIHYNIREWICVWV